MPNPSLRRLETVRILMFVVALTTLLSGVAVGSHPLKVPTGSFLQLDGGNLVWTEKQWRAELESMKQFGMDTLIVGTTVQDTYAFCKIKSYPTWKDCGVSDPLGTILSIADSLKMKVYVGLYAWDWKDQSPIGFDEFTRRCNLIADEVWANYGKRKSFAGWYLLGWEIGNAPDVTNIGVKAHVDVANHLRKITPKMPIIVSPYFTLDAKPEDIEEGWVKILAAMKPTVFSPQDGCGCDRNLTPENVKPYLAACQRAARRAGVTFWINVEVFDIPAGWKPASTDRIIKQIEAASPYAEKIIMFEYNHYLSPQKGFTGAQELAKALKAAAQPK